MKYVALVIIALVLLAGCFLFTGCATRVYENGHLVLETYGDATGMQFSTGRTSLTVSRLNHSVPTRAAGSVVGTGLAGALPIVTSVSTGL